MTTAQRVFLCLLLIANLVGAQDLVILGPVRTADEARPRANALVVKRGIVTSLSRADAEAAALLPDMRVLRVPPGGIAMPGIVESHAHLLAVGRALRELDLSGTDSLAQALDLIRRHCAQLPPGGVLEGRGWNQELWKEKRFPTAKELSAVTGDHPALLTRVDGHAIWVNDIVLRAASINATTPNPEGGEIVRTDANEPSGVLVDNAMSLVDATRSRSSNTIFTDFKAAERRCFEEGITTLVDAGESIENLNLLGALYAAGKADLRVASMVSINSEADLALVLGRPPSLGLYDGRVNVSMVKLYADGALGSRGAWLLQPYTDRPDHCGFPVLAPQFLRKAIPQLMRAGWQVCVHCIGDRAVRETLDAMEEGLSQLDPRQRASARPRIEHAQHIATEDQRRFKELGVIASMQPCHATSDGQWAGERLGAQRMQSGAYVWRNLLSSGASIVAGTDAPVESLSPWRNFDAAVTRRMANGQQLTPEQCFSRGEALLAFTTHGARAARFESVTGLLRPGMAGDVIVLDRDPLTVEATAIGGTRVIATVLAGRVVHESP